MNVAGMLPPKQRFIDWHCIILELLMSLLLDRNDELYNELCNAVYCVSISITLKIAVYLCDDWLRRLATDLVVKCSRLATGQIH